MRMVVRMENSCAPLGAGERRRSPRSRGGRLPEHGWGLSILKTLADRHDGKLETAQETDVYRTTMILKIGAR